MVVKYFLDGMKHISDYDADGTNPERGKWKKFISQERIEEKKNNPVADNPVSLMSFLCGEKVRGV